ncbi:MAG: hypothetical protein PUD20_09355 [bacterium]|nr:hypothetical protein [bacterium]
MVLIVECIISCVLFGVIIVGTVVKKPLFWLNEFPKPVQSRYIELHPETKLKEPEGFSSRVIIKKLIGCLILFIVLRWMVYLAGAHTFVQGLLYSYLIWLVVNIFDTVVLDIGILEHWKKCRLPGTEDMDEEYRLLTEKSLKDGLFGCIIGLPIALLIGVTFFFAL